MIGIAIGVIALLVATNAAQALWLYAMHRQSHRLRDVLEKTDERADRAESDLALETAAHAETRRLLAAERDLRAAVEAERNEAYRTARDHFIEQIKTSGVADAIAFVSRLSLPPPRVLADKVVPAGDPNDPSDDLLKPEL